MHHPYLLLFSTLTILTPPLLALPPQSPHQQQTPPKPIQQPKQQPIRVLPLPASYTIAVQQARGRTLPFALQQPLHTTALLAGAAAVETPAPLPVSDLRVAKKAEGREMTAEEGMEWEWVGEEEDEGVGSGEGEEGSWRWGLFGRKWGKGKEGRKSRGEDRHAMEI